jgi:hypothetical protein
MAHRTAEDNLEEREAGVERRNGVSRRVHFEALVAVGDASGRGGFEAESVDVSPQGMRLRTAYLPQVGERLAFRFDGLGTEMNVEGEVLWRVAEPRGGEFAVRFVGLSAEAAEAVRAMCDAAGSPRPAEAQGTARGTRVRLHIEGLGSPMRARVRGADDAEVQVGSNLEFLRVGRSLELEDVDHGVKREAYIDSVKVDVDPATSVPQLVVALRYGSPPARAARRSSAGVSSAGEGNGARPASATSPGLGVPLEHAPTLEMASDADAVPVPELGLDATMAPAEAARDTDPDTDGDQEMPAGIRGAGSRAARAGMAVAQRVGPALSGAGTKARGAMLALLATVQRKRAERADAKRAALPRRMTAPPPGGALKSEGRRLVREEERADDEGEVPSRLNRKAVAFGGALGLAAVLMVLGVTRLTGGTSGAATNPDKKTSQASAPALPALPAMAGASGSALSADVPLFGATPLSTTEPVPATPADGMSAAPIAGMTEADGEDDGPAGGPADVQGASQFGNGESIKNATVIKVRLDGPIEGLNGAAGAMGFTVSLPGRRALSSASELQRKDRRIESLQIVNNAHGAEVTVRFKDGIPPYLARARGDRLELSFGNEKQAEDKPKKVASKSKSGAAKAAAKPKKKTKKK